MCIRDSAGAVLAPWLLSALMQPDGGCARTFDHGCVYCAALSERSNWTARVPGLERVGCLGRQPSTWFAYAQECQMPECRLAGIGLLIATFVLAGCATSRSEVQLTSTAATRAVPERADAPTAIIR